MASWGIVSYSMFLAYRFNAPLAFATAHRHWQLCPPLTWQEKLMVLATGEPIWGVYVRGYPEYWGAHCQLPAWCSLHFANPIWFVGASVLVAYGGARRWLSAAELLFSVVCLGLPYLTRSYEMAMTSHARFSAVVFPAFITVGYLWQRSRTPGRALLLSLFVISAAYFVIYTALYALGFEVV